MNSHKSGDDLHHFDISPIGVRAYNDATGC
jgi:hypothetical protein